MRHREVGYGLQCRVEQAGGVAMHEVERPHCLIVCGSGRLRRAGEMMSLGVPDHISSLVFETPLEPGILYFPVRRDLPGVSPGIEHSRASIAVGRIERLLDRLGA